MIPLTDDGKKAFELAVRLANAAWKTSQIHRVVWEREKAIQKRVLGGNTNPLTVEEEIAGMDRIRPWGKNEAFNPYDVWLKMLHQQTDRKSSDGLHAVSRVAFEIWKDVLKLSKHSI